ncbi:unnamed protein product [Adineta steineri]|uniref:Uncharacterized protein n=1 Tax=Adineta steineri TaxID=433720 RepID=A0A813QTC2_9BILA|nr:unnamed protein product [Adineta steineri]CAF1160427.1 unnamed protein product [Adineta steineri]CAF1222887.1 unnamed protein product [Adineta steineri]
MDKQITKISDLYRDIWFEIFAYFYVDELFHTFFNVLNDIDSIFLHDNQLRSHVRIGYRSSTNILLKINPNQVISLSVVELDKNQININNMIYLKSIIIRGSNTDKEIEDLLIQMILLREIKNLSISLYCNNRGPDLLNLALRIPGLKTLYIDHMVDWVIDNHPAQIIQSIKNLHLNLYCYLEYIQRILLNLPNIRTLRVKLRRGEKYFPDTLNDLLFNSIKKIHLTILDVSFDTIISFIEKMPNIQIIKINGYTGGANDITYFQSEKWLKLLYINNKKKTIDVSLRFTRSYPSLLENNTGVNIYDEFNKLGLQLTSSTIKGVINL